MIAAATQKGSCSTDELMPKETYIRLQRYVQESRLPLTRSSTPNSHFDGEDHAVLQLG